jgi:hypothetical protein
VINVTSISSAKRSVIIMSEIKKVQCTRTIVPSVIDDRFYKTRNLQQECRACDNVKCGTYNKKVRTGYKCYMLKNGLKASSETYILLLRNKIQTKHGPVS